MRFYFKKNLAYLFLVYTLLLLTCQKTPTGPPGIKDVYPLAVGNYWLYEGKFYPLSPIFSEIREEIIGKDRLSDGSSVFVKRKIFFHSASLSDTVISYLKFEGNELREYLDKNHICEFKILLKAPLYIGAGWSTDSCFCPACPLTVAFKDSVETTENITVPAGSFSDCYRIVTCNCPVYVPTGWRWFAPYVGVTQLIEEKPWGAAGYLLKEYRVR